MSETMKPGAEYVNFMADRGDNDPESADAVQGNGQELSGEATSPAENSESGVEALRKNAINALGSQLHDKWRDENFRNEDGSYRPRVKVEVELEAGKKKWINETEVGESDKVLTSVDIANTAYAELPEHWQAENKAAAETAVNLVLDAQGKLDLSDQATYDRVGDAVHKAWLSRNGWQKDVVIKDGNGNPYLKKDGSPVKYGDAFVGLPPAEQEKDIQHIRMAMKMLGLEGADARLMSGNT